MLPRLSSRIHKEMKQMMLSPAPGVSAFPIEDDYSRLNAQIIGPEDSPYYNGLFNLKIDIPHNYPFEPPKVQFITPIYHPNIDCEGRICLDTLKPQPQGTWSPSLNINTVLLTIRLLLAHPNELDGLVPDITEEYRRAYDTYRRNAEDHTRKYATAVQEFGKVSSPLVDCVRGNEVGSKMGDSADGNDSDVDADGTAGVDANLEISHRESGDEISKDNAGTEVSVTVIDDGDCSNSGSASAGRYAYVGSGFELIGCIRGCEKNLRQAIYRALPDERVAEEFSSACGSPYATAGTIGVSAGKRVTDLKNLNTSLKKKRF